ncbi:PfkB family carbohydrate kinase [Bacillus sp. 1P06AnD]|uniref:PfkB family carbohydrate kinase n=1 Tax=Bacillus sp. 1P06AnD TaxID=3132208 RepID=UPI0039A22A27
MKSLLIGAAVVDIIMRIPKLPEKGGDIYCSGKHVTVGGCAFNVANILRGFNVEYSLLVPVGEGMNASIVRKGIEENGHQILIYDPEMDNGQCLCLVEDDGERTFITTLGIEGHFKKEWLETIMGSDYENIYFDGYQMCSDGAASIVEWLEKQADKRLFFAPGPVIQSIDKELMERICALHPIVHLNEREAQLFTGQTEIESAVQQLFNHSQNKLFVTLGAEGTLFYDGCEMMRIEGESAAAVDTIGAGDSHVAAIMAALSLGYNDIQACSIANKVAAKMVQTEGPTLRQQDFDRDFFLAI